MWFWLDQHLHQLEAERLIRLAVAEERGYWFKHALIQEAAYGTLVRRARLRIHRAVAETLEATYAAQRAEWAAVVGHHYREAEDERAAAYFALAGEQALARYANAEATQHYREALRLTHIPITPVEQRAHAGWLSGLGRALNRQSQYTDAIAVWQQAIALYQTLGETEALARLYARAARASWWSGNTPQALALCRAGLAQIPPQLETPGLAALLHEAARACFFNGELAEARPLCERGLALAQRLNALPVQIEALTTLALLLRREHASDRALELLHHATQLAEASGLPTGELLLAAGRAYNNLAELLEEDLGDLAAAREQYQRSADMVRRRRSANEELFVLNQIAAVTLLQGDLAGVTQLLPALRTLGKETGNAGLGSLNLLWVEGQLWRYQGEGARALACLRACQAALRQRGDQEHLGRADFSLAELLLDLGDLPAAREAAQEAVEISDRGLGPQIRARGLLASVLIQQGDLTAARAWLTEARALAGPQPLPLDQAHLLLAVARLAVAHKEWAVAFNAFESAAAVEAHLGRRWYAAQVQREWAAARAQA
jgi:tetratricopeptide (TPR) repeat protein